MLRLLLISMFASWVFCAESATPRLSTPRIGEVRLSDGSIRRVVGSPGGFVLGSPLIRGALSASFSDKGGIVALANKLVILDHLVNPIGEEPVEGPAIVNVSGDPTTAIAWIAKNSTLVFWSGTSFTSVTAQGVPNGNVWAIRRSGNQAVLMVDEQQVTVSAATGNLIDCHPVPGIRPTAVAQATGQNIDDLTIEQMSDQYLHVFSRVDARTWVVTANGDGRLWELPSAKANQ